MLTRSCVSALLCTLAVGFIPRSAAYAYDSDPGAGHVYSLTYDWSFPASNGAEATSGSNSYLVYTPAGWTASEKLPLYVVLHGCPAVAGNSAVQTMDATRVNPIADSQHFIVAYPDNGDACWHAASPGREHTERGGGGDADIVAGITRAVISAYDVDSQRVYIIGFSSGADQASATAYAYPDLYAAAGVNSGAGPSMDTTCIGLPDQVAPYYAQSTVADMGPRARVIPFFAIGGDSDPFGEADYAGSVDPTGLHPKADGCSRLAYLEALDIDDLLVPGSNFQTSYTQTGQVTTAEDGTPEQGHTWTRMVALDRYGCEVAENWIVTGMGHTWSGGSTDPSYSSYGINDPKGPSTGAASWAFFQQFTLSGGNTACHSGSSSSPGPAPQGPPGPYTASTFASLMSVNALDVPGHADASNLEVAPVSATVDSAAGGRSPKSLADARNLAIDPSYPGVDQNPLVEARQAVPPTNTSPTHQELTSVPAAPVLNADLATADAHAQWAENSCISDGPITTAKSTLVDAQVEPDGASDGGENWQGNEVGMDDYISPSGTATSTGTIQLDPHTTDDRYSLDATATTQVSGINVSDALYIEVISPARAEVIATGIPGTAEAVLSQPVLRVEGMTLASGQTYTSSTAAGPVIEVTPGRVTASVSADGRAVKASGTLADIKFLSAGLLSALDVAIGSVAATASVPGGGVGCPAVSAAGGRRPTSATQPASISGVSVSPAGSRALQGATPVTGSKRLSSTTPSGAVGSLRGGEQVEIRASRVPSRESVLALLGETSYVAVLAAWAGVTLLGWRRARKGHP